MQKPDVLAAIGRDKASRMAISFRRRRAEEAISLISHTPASTAIESRLAAFQQACDTVTDDDIIAYLKAVRVESELQHKRIKLANLLKPNGFKYVPAVDAIAKREKYDSFVSEIRKEIDKLQSFLNSKELADSKARVSRMFI